jgi:hypothetical protein
VAFVDDIVLAARYAGVDRGLYIGCGNGRNYVPLTGAGLDLIGLDVSATAIAQLAARLPGRRVRLIAGDLSALASGERFPLVVAIQVLQHGTREEAHGLLADSLSRAAVGGLFAVRLSARFGLVGLAGALATTALVLVDVVIADPEPDEDRLAAEFFHAEQGAPVRPGEAPGHRVVHTDSVDAQRPWPQAGPGVRACVERGTEQGMHRLDEHLAVLFWQPSQIGQEGQCSEVLHWSSWRSASRSSIESYSLPVGSS